MTVTALGIAMLGIPVAQAADAATPTCMGKRATIVGTAGKDILRGTKRADVIVAKGGSDVIKGRGGNDLICAGGGNDEVTGGGGADKVLGGAGNDTITGGYGKDRLLGQGGDDLISGGAANDTINGGTGIDTCAQDGGTGVIKNCEIVEEPESPDDPEPPHDPEPPAPTTADLGVSVQGPRQSKSGEVTFRVTVTNHGPAAVPYTLTLTQVSQKAVCVAATWAGDHVGPALASGDSRAEEVLASCVKKGGGAKVGVRASVDGTVTDPVPENDSTVRRTKLR
jgi:Ca2+-binding RTX toxin-like protein